MSSSCKSLELAQQLVRRDTVMGGSGERAALEFLADMLAGAGFACVFDSYEEGGWSLSARLNPGTEGPALCLAGHIDTVPLGLEPWQHDPFAGDILDGCLYGRGSCDMKSGVAAMVCAALRMAPAISRELVLQIYGGEERGCLGSFHLGRRAEELARVQALVVGEPTGAIPLVGHKGALWLTLTARGRTAHASMPEKGLSALATLLPAATRLLDYTPGGEHRYLGRGTCVLSTLHAGLNSNSVPDLARLTMDIRTVPGTVHAALCQEIASVAGDGITMEKTLDIPPVWTDPDLAWVQQVFAAYEKLSGAKAAVSTVQFFTDAAAVRSFLPEVPVLIFGPGESSQAHKVNEACPVEQIAFMEEMYCHILADWYETQSGAD